MVSCSNAATRRSPQVRENGREGREAMFFFFRRLLQIEAESKRTHTIPSHILSPDYKDAIMRQKYVATIKPVSILGH